MNDITPEMAHKIHVTLRSGGVIAYPTESVYGLGCDPFNETAVNKIAKLKGRTLDKGFILIASQWDQINELITPLDPERLKIIKATWPGPVTWVFPCSVRVPKWIRGNFDSVAIRLTTHPIARNICDVINQAVVSTSANRAGENPARSMQAVKEIFGNDIDLVIEGEVGTLSQPTPIRDAITGKYLRH